MLRVTKSEQGDRTIIAIDGNFRVTSRASGSPGAGAGGDHQAREV